MNLRLLLQIVLARRRVLIGTFLLTVISTLIVSLLLPKTYTATSAVVMNYKGVDPLTGLAMPGQLMPGYMATQIDIIGSKNVALRVVDRLRLAESAAVKAQFQEATGGRGTVRDWLADLLLKKLDVSPSRESSVVNISFNGSDPEFVAAVANAYAEEYQNVTIQLKVDPMKRAASYFDTQMKSLRDNVEAAQSRLSKYQQEHDIVSVDNRLDVETNRLNELSAQLVVAQTQLMEAQSRRSMAASGGSAAPDVASNPLIQNLNINLNSAEGKLAEAEQRLGRNHPQYLSLKAEVDKLRRELGRQMKLTSESVGNNASVLQQREASLKAALAQQRTKVLEMNRARDELNVLAKDVESAQRAFDTASQRFSQTRIEAHAEQSDVMLLNPAVPPTDASSPRVLLNTLLAVMLGTMLGIGFSVLLELLDRRIRLNNDLDSLGISMLGAVDWKASQRGRSSRLGKLLPRRLSLN
jgi:chain length determinant protein EpsF